MNVTTDPTALELDDIQNGAIRPRPSPYVGVYFLLRIDERQAGRELLRRLLPALASATNPADRGKQAWVTWSRVIPMQCGRGVRPGRFRLRPRRSPHRRRVLGRTGLPGA